MRFSENFEAAKNMAVEAAQTAAAKAKETELGTLTLKHIEDYAEELKSAGIESEDVSPLLLPHYARHER